MLELQQAQATTAYMHHPIGQEMSRAEPSASVSGHLWVAELLEQLDYGLLIVQRDLSMVQANRLALRRLGLDATTGGLADSLARGSDEAGRKRLIRAVALAVDQALRSSVQLRLGRESVVLAVVPARAPSERRSGTAMLLIEREHLCTRLALAGFGRLHGMTSAELAVLSELCAGREPAAIAKQQGVSLSTVRTHVVAVRSKIGVRSMREMLIAVGRLPPIAEVLPG